MRWCGIAAVVLLAAPGLLVGVGLLREAGGSEELGPFAEGAVPAAVGGHACVAAVSVARRCKSFAVLAGGWPGVAPSARGVVAQVAGGVCAPPLPGVRGFVQVGDGACGVTVVSVKGGECGAIVARTVRHDVDEGGDCERVLAVFT